MVKIRLMRMGKRKQPYFRVVVADARSPRDGRFLENIGKYHPRSHPSVIDIDEDRALHWLRQGAQPSDPVRVLLQKTGVWGRFTGQGPTEAVPPPEDRATEPPSGEATVTDQTAEADSSAATATDEPGEAASGEASVEGAQTGIDASDDPERAPETGASQEDADAEPEVAESAEGDEGGATGGAVEGGDDQAAPETRDGGEETP